MNRKFYFAATLIAIVLVIIAFSSCKTTKEVKTRQDKTTIDNSVNGGEERTIQKLVLDTAEIYTQTDSFLLVNAVLSGKILEIEVEYGGGCGGDSWTLAWNGMMMKSYPPKMNVYLHFKDEDNCRSIVRKKLYFDISSIHDKEAIIYLKNFRGVLDYKP